MHSPKLDHQVISDQDYFFNRMINLIYLCSLVLLSVSLYIRDSGATPPKHRIDLSSAYTSVDVGDWQMIAGSYTYQLPALTTGIATRVLRRDLPTYSPTDLSIQLPIYTAFGPLSLECWGEWSPDPVFVPQYAIQVSPALRFSSILSALHLTYRYAEYAIAHAQLVTPGFTWSNPTLGWGVGGFLYVTIPEFGEVLYTPQLRIERLFSYFWRTELWITYGYETLNDRFVDPTRQAPQISLYTQLKHLFSDYSGLNIGLAWVKFLPQTDQMAQERFNQDRLEVSIRTFYRF
jgi:hypothetical protein